MTWPDRCRAHDGKYGARDVHRADQGRRELPIHLLGSQLFEEAGVEIAGIVDEDVDPTEAFDRGLHGGLGIGGVRDIELDCQHVFGVARRTR